MISIVLTYRDRDLNIVKKCLKSLNNQSLNEFKVILVDYGSQHKFSKALQKLVNEFFFVKLVYCPVNGQLWNKSRAINIGLNLCDTQCFFVGDIDMIYHPNLINTLLNLSTDKKTIYFQVGFLNKVESEKDKDFNDYQINFKSTDKATGLTLYNADILRSINGYDEFYHGWGSEDTDVHVRLINAGYKVHYYNETILMLHQWHAKGYRSKDSSSPFHSSLERVNHYYMLFTINNKVIKANIDDKWGVLPNKESYLKLLKKPDFEINIQSIDFHFSALLAHLKNFDNGVLRIQINKENLKDRLSQKLKKILNKKYFNYLKLETVNNLLLEEIIKNYRNNPYTYNYKKDKGIINLTIYFN